VHFREKMIEKGLLKVFSNILRYLDY